MLNTNRLSINAIGKIKKTWINEGIKQYRKRMPNLAIYEFKDFKINNLKNLFAENIIIISLTEEGKYFNSQGFSSLLLNYQNKKISFFIGDEDGLTNDIKSRSDLLLSLSPFTFPHELARLILIEQIYRAVSISQNSPYHRS
tara:strand:- start:1053 stop:1478 length:426 start_codon:yes stop_codon:yes gene_type:complete